MGETPVDKVENVGHLSAGELEVYKLLRDAKLLQYFPGFIEHGGDDVNQLRALFQDPLEFTELLKLVGMERKPLHVQRLKTALAACGQKELRNTSSMMPSYLVRPIALSPCNNQVFAMSRAVVSPQMQLTSPLFPQPPSNYLHCPLMTAIPTVQKTSPSGQLICHPSTFSLPPTYETPRQYISRSPPVISVLALMGASSLLTDSPDPRTVTSLNSTSSLLSDRTNPSTSSHDSDGLPAHIRDLTAQTIPAESGAGFSGRSVSIPASTTNRKPSGEKRAAGKAQYRPTTLPSPRCPKSTETLEQSRLLFRGGSNNCVASREQSTTLKTKGKGEMPSVQNGCFITKTDMTKLTIATTAILPHLPKFLRRSGNKEIETLLGLPLTDETRIQGIRKHSMIFGRASPSKRPHRSLRHFEVIVNEVTSHLALSSPELVTNRDHLFHLARQVVKIMNYGMDVSESGKVYWTKDNVDAIHKVPQQQCSSTEGECGDGTEQRNIFELLTRLTSEMQTLINQEESHRNELQKLVPRESKTVIRRQLDASVKRLQDCTCLLARYIVILKSLGRSIFNIRCVTKQLQIHILHPRKRDPRPVVATSSTR